MGNTIDWGQAAVNNTIGFGDGAENNTIGWGDIQADSWSPETNLTGTGGTPAFTNTLSTTFDGTDDFVDCGNPSSLQITGALTLSAWVKRDVTSSTANYVIIGKDSTTSTLNRGYLLNVNPTTNKIQLVIFYDSIGSINIVASTSSIVTDQWTHVMGVNDGTDLKIYINGVLENTNVGGGNVINNTPINFNIGRRASSPSTRGYWNGEIDEVAVWDSDQSTNASAIYNSGTPTDLTSYSPISWWRMGDGSTYPTINDEIGSNNGTMTNMTSANFVTDVPT